MNEEKFTGKAEIYDKYRPSYPDRFVDTLFEKTNAGKVADIGAGTGIFTECLLKRPWAVTAVEPNGDMFKILKDKLSFRALVVKATAENTGLKSESYDLITAAQAFHWFDKPLFFKECRRLLTSGGYVAVIWNTRCGSDFNDEAASVFQKYRPEQFNGSAITGYKSFDCDELFKCAPFEKYETFTCNHSQIMNKEYFIGNFLSHSYALKEGEPGYEDFLGELQNIFDKFNSGGKLEQEYISTCYLGKVK